MVRALLFSREHRLIDLLTAALEKALRKSNRKSILFTKFYANWCTKTENCSAVIGKKTDNHSAIRVCDTPNSLTSNTNANSGNMYAVRHENHQIRDIITKQINKNKCPIQIMSNI
jgi:hypothetical protein